MGRYRITAPVEGANCTVAGTVFANSVAETDSDAAVAYFRRHGYTVEALDTHDEPPVRPAQSASKAEWVGYAVRAHGMTPDAAEAMTKADLIERYGGKEGDQ